MTAPIPFRRPGREPPAPKPPRVRKPKAPPNLCTEAGLALKGKMASLTDSARRAQLCLSGSFITEAATADLRRQLEKVEGLAKQIRRQL